MPDRMAHPDEHYDRPDLVKKRTRVIIMDRLWRTFLSVVMLITIGILIYDVTVAAATREKIADCTTPNGECYQRGEERTGEVLIDVGEIVRLTMACADKAGVQTEEEIQRCVEKGLEER